MEKLITLPPDINTHWNAIAPLLIIRNEDEYEQAIELLNNLIDEIGTNEQHPLYNLLDTLGTLIEVYEKEHYSIPNCSGSDVLAYLMEEHRLCLSDLPEIGTSATIEAILNKHQALTLSQVQQLAQRFQVQPQVFLD
ncbi:transcriptional regulator [Dolichospermum circinale CS-1225]|uniref:Transcriptional regulator n=1 Tax=Dolichospermum circinale CS-537/01 TaxID=3021739 RepID=A0ABT5ABI6_9CYAN|nr:transcriptional regulator [Dolichospermum circinale]MDB9459376.1 transcriptional regulator [Dolichospermum circinale CS-545/17]MDB9468638.1 transcriptional regulator [Dolichospermum circinale CS-539/09]MDB9471489.1 transcriptional regulator [Dolichospermum circinale CS-539]MDB9488803.1 transcriptional regulator [Dolichospermum circinale CS-537/01]MDB9521263.1 transcriptional regulator [Dolichospermum circinale CS-1225]